MKKQFTQTMVCLILVFVFCGWLLDRDTATAQSTLTSKDADASFLDQKIAEATFVTAVLDYLDSGQPQDAAHLLRLRQGSDILAINDLLLSANGQSRNTANGLFRRIAKSRPNWKSDYHGALPQADTNVTSEVESVLKKYR